MDEMKRRALLRRRDVVNALGLWGATLLLQGCLTGDDVMQLVSSSGSSLSSQGQKFGPEEERQMGEALYAPTIEQAGGVYRNRRVQQAMLDFCIPLFANSPRADLKWEVTVVDDNTVNAWALPGGKIGVNKGLLRYVANDAELAAVIAHEMTHVEKSHAVRELEDGKRTKALTEVGKNFGTSLIETRTGMVGSVAGQTGLTDKVLSELQAPLVGLITSGYSRSNENEADAGIVTVFQRERYPARNTYSFFETLLAIIPPDSGATTSLYSKHPDTRARIDRLRTASTSLGGGAAKPASNAFAQLKRSFPTRKAAPPATV